MGDRGINDRIINCEKIKYRQSDFPVSYHYDTVGKAKNAQSGLANWHEEIEILYFTEGEAELYVNLEGHHVKAGDVIFLYPYWLHRTVNLTPLCRYHCLLIHPSFIGFTHEATTDFLISSSDEIRENVRRIVSEMREAQPGYQTIVFGEINALIGRFSRCPEVSESYAVPDPQLDSMRQVLRYIRTNYNQKITVADICNLVHLSPSYFSQCFSRIMGCSLMVYLNRMRCEKAYQMISSTSLSIMECALECGFSNKSYFTRKFREIYHILPSDVRTQRKKPADK